MKAEPSAARASMWRAQVAFRIAACLYCVVVIVRLHRTFAHPAEGLLVAALIVLWTAVATWVTLRLVEPGWRWVTTDFLVATALTLCTMHVQTFRQSHGAIVTLTSVWVAAPVLGAAILGGWRWGAWFGAMTAAVSVVVRQGYDGRTMINIFLLITAGATVGYVGRLVTGAETDLAQAHRERAALLAEQAALAERVRLSRSIHDGVLQVLALVQRRGAEEGGEAAVLGRLAGEQEEALRALVTSDAFARRPGSTGAVDERGGTDLAAKLLTRRSSGVTVAVPASPVVLPSAVMADVVGAVGEALRNVGRHAGVRAHAWVLLEDDPGGEVIVTVRDDGDGIAPGRLAEAAAAGRMGVTSSIRGRIEELGGSVSIESAPGQGTEVELRLARQAWVEPKGDR